MTESVAYQQYAGTTSRNQAHTLFARTMAYVAVTAALFAAAADSGINSAPLLAASIFLDILNVFLFFLSIFSNQEGN